MLYCPLPPEVFVADDGQFPFPVSGVGVGVGVLVIGAAWHVDGGGGSRFLFIRKMKIENNYRLSRWRLESYNLCLN